MIKSKFFKIIWGLNGIFILILVLLVIFSWVNEYMPAIFKGSARKFDTGIIVGENVEKAKTVDFDLQHLIYESPQKIKNSDYYYAEIVVVDKELPKSVKDAINAANDFSTSMIGATINVVFYNEDRTDAHKLLEKYAFIKTISAPVGFQSNYPKDTQEKLYRDFILYEIGFKDTDGDGRINDSDSTAFFISNLKGKDLRRITPYGLNISNYSFTKDFSEIFFEQEATLGSKDIQGHELKRREFYYYNLDVGKFGKFEKLNSILDQVTTDFYNSQ